MPNSGTKQSFNDQAIESIHRDGGGLCNSGVGVVANPAALAAGSAIALVTGGEPAGITGQFALASGRPGVGGARFTAQDCLLANVGPTRLAYHQGRWQLSSDKVSVDSACLSKLPGGDASSAPLALDQLQRELPSLDLTLNDLTLIPWQRYAGKLQLSSGPDGQRLHYQGPNLSAEAQLDENSS